MINRLVWAPGPFCRLGALRLSVSETVLVYIGIPAALVLVIAGLVMLGSRRTAKRYRPGRSFDFTPVWFLSSPQPVPTAAGQAELPAGAQRAELEAQELTAPTVTKPQGATGGASDRW